MGALQDIINDHKVEIRSIDYFERIYWQYLIASFHGNAYRQRWYARQAYEIAFVIRMMKAKKQFYRETRLKELRKNEIYFYGKV